MGLTVFSWLGSCKARRAPHVEGSEFFRMGRATSHWFRSLWPKFADSMSGVRSHWARVFYEILSLILLDI